MGPIVADPHCTASLETSAAAPEESGRASSGQTGIPVCEGLRRRREWGDNPCLSRGFAMRHKYEHILSSSATSYLFMLANCFVGLKLCVTNTTWEETNDRH